MLQFLLKCNFKNASVSHYIVTGCHCRAKRASFFFFFSFLSALYFQLVGLTPFSFYGVLCH